MSFIIVGGKLLYEYLQNVRCSCYSVSEILNPITVTSSRPPTSEKTSAFLHISLTISFILYVQETIAKIDPMPGAKEFLDELRSFTQVIIISDTFTQFAAPLMKKLGWPTIFCNSLEVAPGGEITGFKMRIENSKYTTVKALQSIGFQTIASGDSYNDLGMIKASKAGFLFKSTDKIKADNPDLPAYETYDELMAAIKKAMD